MGLTVVDIIGCAFLIFCLIYVVRSGIKCTCGRLFNELKRDEQTPIYTLSFAGVYPHYITKAEKKGRTKEDVDQIIEWLTGYVHQGASIRAENKAKFEDYFDQS